MEITIEIILLSLSVFLAVFTQSLAGFGVALVAMALLPNLVGIKVAVPLVALVALVLETILSIRYRESFKIKTIWKMAFASIIGIPIGVWALKGMDELFATRFLGIMIIVYAVYALFNFRLPRLRNPIWEPVVGFIAGLTGGALNIAGPPYIIYGNCRRWEMDEFKGNLQGLFVVNSLVVLISHATSGNITNTVWCYFLFTIPALIIGIFIGTSLDRYIHPETFRKIVLILLIFLSTRLIMG